MDWCLSCCSYPDWTWRPCFSWRKAWEATPFLKILTAIVGKFEDDNGAFDFAVMGMTLTETAQALSLQDVTGVFGRQFSSNSCNNCLGRRKGPEVAKVAYLRFWCLFDPIWRFCRNWLTSSKAGMFDFYETALRNISLIFVPSRLLRHPYNYKSTCWCGTALMRLGGNGLEANDLHWETVRKEDVSGRFGFKLLRQTFLVAFVCFCLINFSGLAKLQPKRSIHFCFVKLECLTHMFKKPRVSQ